MAVKIISASAGSGKTDRLTKEYYRFVSLGKVEPEKVIAVTFTRAAAEELKERVRRMLFEKGMSDAARRMEGALVGTVHSVCETLLRRFAFEAGISPDIQVLPEVNAKLSFNESLSMSFTAELREKFTPIADRFELDYTDRLRDVRKIAELARANAVPPSLLRKRDKKRSLRGYLRHFPAPSWPSEEAAGKEILRVLKAAIQALEETLRSGEDGTIASGEYLEFLKSTYHTVEIGRLPWRIMGGLSSKKPGAKSAKIAARVQELGVKLLGHPLLREDVTGYVEVVYELAARSLEAYDRWKKERGLIDFTDMEEKTLQLLRDDEVCRSLEEEFSILLVDEFQDTSPIQLALFSRLEEIVDEVVWVGDKKQSIFGFRDSDPELMERAFGAVLKGKDPVPLSESHRSRPELVYFCNKVFVRTFGAHGYPEKEVALDPKRTEKKGMPPPVECWVMESKKKEEDSVALASGVAALLAEPSRTPVEDKVSRLLRPLRPGDIAILCRSNKACRQAAGELEKLGLRATVAREGLIETPEGALLLAAMEVVIDPRASLPALTVLLLAEGMDPERLLDERLAAFAGSPGSKAAWENHNLLKRLRSLCAETAALSPAGVLDRIIEAGGIRDICVRWGGGAHLDNIEKIRFYAEEYEEMCRLNRSGASLLGLYLYLQESENGGEQAAFPSEDTVTVSTYHKAKGLEWHVVILGELDKRERTGCCCNDPRIQSEGAEFNIRDPLSGRWIRFWPWPYAKLSKGAPLYDILMSTPEENDARERDNKEEQRLLYVGFTRPRDVLVLTTRRGKPVPAEIELLKAGLSLPVESPPGDGDHQFGDAGSIRSRVRTLDLECAGIPAGEKTARWFSRPGGAPPERKPLFVHPSIMAPSVSAKVGEMISRASRMPLRGKLTDEEPALGNAMHAFFAADRPESTPEDRLAMAERLLEAHGAGAFIAPADMVGASDWLHSQIAKRWPGARLHHELPLIAVGDGQIIKGVSDLVVEADGEFHIIDHKAFPGSAEQCRERALSHAPQLAAYSAVLAKALAMPCASTWIHFPVAGLLVPLSLRQQ